MGQFFQPASLHSGLWLDPGAWCDSHKQGVVDVVWDYFFSPKEGVISLCSI